MQVHFCKTALAVVLVGVAGSSAWAQARAPQTQPRTGAQQPAQGQPAQAQGQPRQGQPGQPQQGQARTALRPVQGAAQGPDAMIAQLLMIDAQGEVQLGRLAEQRTQNEQVRELAQSMVRDHGQSLTALERVAGPLPQAPAAARGQAGAAGQQAMQPLNPVTLKQQISQEYLTWTTEELNKRKGAAFDIAFVGQQIDRHMQALSTEQVLRQYASPQLQQMIAQDMQHAEHHLALARQIMNQLDSERGAQDKAGDADAGATEGTRPATGTGTAPATGGNATGGAGTGGTTTGGAGATGGTRRGAATGGAGATGGARTK